MSQSFSVCTPDLRSNSHIPGNVASLVTEHQMKKKWWVREDERSLFDDDTLHKTYNQRRDSWPDDSCVLVGI